MYGLRWGAFYLPGEAVGAPLRFHPSPNFALIGRPASMLPSSSLNQNGSSPGSAGEAAKV
jgi:hypothetical protein